MLVFIIMIFNQFTLDNFGPMLIGAIVLINFAIILIKGTIVEIITLIITPEQITDIIIINFRIVQEITQLNLI